VTKSSQVEAFQGYAEQLAWLYGLQRFGIKLGLENAEKLFAPLEPALQRSRIFHVAGTNGKGSVCAMIDAICRAAGRRTGLFTSPHLVTFRERIRVNGEMISENAAAEGLTSLRSRVAGWEPHPTFFEITTALALDYFVAQRCDVIVLETGLGGRLDATNAVAANISVITPIDLDHQQYLGHTLGEIAAEKAGIIKEGTPVISAPQRPEAAKVIRERAEECQAPLEFIEKPYEATPVGWRGTHQKWNAALALAAVRKMEPDISGEEIARGLLNVEWPARFQSFDDRILVDGAHNPAAAAILTQTWQEFFGEEKATIVAATLSDKETAGILQALGPIAARFVLPRVKSERASEPMELKKVADDLGFDAEMASSFADAREKALRYRERILITGSLHFAGEALAALRGEPAAYEECAQ
jgi:dihydrofolate synthase / folylpolyglutamate synthase